MERKKGTTESLSASKMAKRIANREDNVYDKRIIENILNMYMDECRKALLRGERILIKKVGTIIAEVKARMSYCLPICNKEGGNPPYTKLRISRTNLLKDTMNKILIKNIENGIYGLEKLPLGKKQLDILRDSGYIPEDAKISKEE